jgi:hypothetical protein
MFGWFKKIGKRTVQPASELSAQLGPEPGQKWVFIPEQKDPWERKHYPPVTILDVRDGWVRYAMQSVFTDERTTIKSFTRMYRRVA